MEDHDSSCAFQSLTLLIELCHWIMESSSEDQRSSHIMIQPNETVLTALPYEPQSSLLDFLKGEPKVLGVSALLSTGFPRKGEKKLFFQVCLNRHRKGLDSFSGRDLIPLLFPHVLPTMFPSSLIIKPPKLFACTNKQIFSRRANM